MEGPTPGPRDPRRHHGDRRVYLDRAINPRDSLARDALLGFIVVGAVTLLFGGHRASP